MKKFFVAVVVAIFVLGFASCKSECECTVEGTGVTTSVGKISKKECKDAEKKANEAGMGIVKTKCSN